MEDALETKLILYSDNRLPCPQRVLITTAELGIELTTIPIDILKKEHKTPAYSELTNNFNAVPFLTNAAVAFKLRESRAISRYLCLLYPSPLLPPTTDMLATARFEEAASMEATGWDPVANRLAFEAYFKSLFGGTPDESLVQDLRHRLQGVLDGMERVLGEGDHGGRRYMSGNDFTLVDVFYVPYMLKLTSLYWKEIFDGREKLEEWWMRVSERPSVSSLVARGMDRP